MELVQLNLLLDITFIMYPNLLTVPADLPTLLSLPVLLIMLVLTVTRDRILFVIIISSKEILMISNKRSTLLRQDLMILSRS